MTESQPARADRMIEGRQNRKGSLCPPWCRTDHDISMTHIGGGGSIGEIWARAILGTRGACVGVTGGGEWHDGSAYLEVDPGSAMHLAGMVEALAGATPDEHRELAEAIRQAAAQITDAEARR